MAVVYNRNDYSDDDDDARSTVSSDVVEVDSNEIPSYFVERDGRLFHSHGRCPYPLPVDADEQRRQNGLHDTLLRLIGEKFVGPVPQVLALTPGEQKRVVDLGTGTGKWVLEMAQEYPHVKFMGLDIVPIATRSPPRNVQFEIHNINERFRFPSDNIDFVHARSISMAVSASDYRTLLREVARVLRPGATLECTHLAHASSSMPFAVLCTLQSGIGPAAPHIPGWLVASGMFQHVQARRYLMPVGDWHPEPVLQALGRDFREMLVLYAQSMKIVLCSNGLSANEVERLYDAYLQEIFSVPGMSVRTPCVAHFPYFCDRRRHCWCQGRGGGQWRGNLFRDFLVKAGSRFESKPGVAHALKNFAFKSTDKRSTLGTVREAELYGGVLSSSLSREHLAITAEFLRGDEAFFVDVLSSFLTSAKLTRHELTEWVGPVCEAESAAAFSNPATRAIELAHALAFRSGLGSSLFASAGTHVSAEDVKAFAASVFGAGNVAVLGTGINPATLQKLLEKSLGSISKTAAPASPASSYFGGETRLDAHGGPETVFIGFGSTGAPSAELAVLAAHLDPTPSVKWSQGLSPIAAGVPAGASVQAVLFPYSDATLFGLLVQGATTADVKAAGKAAVAALKTAGDVKGEELQKAIVKAKFSVASAVDGRDGLVSVLGSKILSGSPANIDGTCRLWTRSTHLQSLRRRHHCSRRVCALLLRGKPITESTSAGMTVMISDGA
ncbi:Cytochrome b-c1 complex subunit 2, mitochondrial [Grifola frondosa]|uniref:Cytochrome b-c1 complex subunit 2, mitochondrial n=1 Tax=Grifola frondosa TaxID=5627 RepID=A0A1C7ME27_GRIFR|nr:Cytochrome b-c1 complex subunit 2, mitochondrial [Grifola frondosa]